MKTTSKQLLRLGLFGFTAGLVAAACGSNADGPARPANAGNSGDSGFSGDSRDEQGGIGGAPNVAGAASTAGAAAASGDTSTAGAAGASEAPCIGLECQVPQCSGTSTTTLSGRVYAPSGDLPLYGVQLLVPNGPLPAFSERVSCGRCSDDTTPFVTRTLSDANGDFVLEGVPAGVDIPLVLQIGRWRRQVVVPEVTACADNPLDDPELTRLPRNSSEGDLPRIALAMGANDALECWPRRLGVDDSEFTTRAGEGHIHLFRGADAGGLSTPARFAPALNEGALIPPSTELWQDPATLSGYDMVLLGCEGTPAAQQKPLQARQALADYAALGGRLFVSHWQHIWLSDGPLPLPMVGNWSNREDPVEFGSPPLAVDVIRTFPDGNAFASWLVNTDASATKGKLELQVAHDNLQTVDPLGAKVWLSVENPKANGGDPVAVQAMSFKTPYGAASDQQCGRSLFTAFHVSKNPQGGQGTPAPKAFPLDCEVRALSADEKAFAFLFFHLSSCIED